MEYNFLKWFLSIFFLADWMSNPFDRVVCGDFAGKKNKRLKTFILSTIKKLSIFNNCQRNDLLIGETRTFFHSVFKNPMFKNLLLSTNNKKNINNNRKRFNLSQ